MAKHKFTRVLTYVKPYWASVILNIVFNLMAIVFLLLIIHSFFIHTI